MNSFPTLRASGAVWSVLIIVILKVGVICPPSKASIVRALSELMC